MSFFSLRDVWNRLLAFGLRWFRGRFDVTARKVVVRPYFPWAWFVLAILSVNFAAWFAWEAGLQGGAGLSDEALVLREQLRMQSEELAALRSSVGTGRSAVSIERASQLQLLAKIQVLEAQNASLKEDILLFERLIPVVGDVASLRVERFRVSSEPLGVCRYRLLLAFQADKQNPEFRGRFQLRVGYSLLGKSYSILLPEKRDGVVDYHLEVRHFLRREGVFGLPEGALLQSVEVLVFQGDTLKVRRLAEL